MSMREEIANAKFTLDLNVAGAETLLGTNGADFNVLVAAAWNLKQVIAVAQSFGIKAPRAMLVKMKLCIRLRELAPNVTLYPDSPVGYAYNVLVA